MRIIADRNIPFAREAFRRFGDVDLVETGEMTPFVVRSADAILVRSETAVDASLLQESSVRFVGTATIGTDHIDTEYLQGRGIEFASAPGCNAESVVEYLAAALLTWGEAAGTSLREKTIGIVGVGNVGSRVVRVATTLGMRTLLCDPPLARSTGDSRYRPLDALMDADILSLHVPLTRGGSDPTYHLIDADRLARMKAGAVVVNTARGAVVDTTALLEALAGGRVGAAILDVWEREPAIDPRAVECAFLATPHIAGYSLDGKVNAVRMLVDALARFTDEDSSDPPNFPLPQPSAERIAPDVSPRPEQQLLYEIVTTCYDIRRDDGALRAIASVREADRGSFFQKLRTSYPVRREFSATTVVLPPAQENLVRTLQGLGFRVDTPVRGSMRTP
ncbi:MAG: 4-phosphoerythronate dehydrogenase [Bacteroidota bacterium]